MAQPGEARLLLGAPIAAEIRAGVKADVEAFQALHGYAPGLAVVIVGADAPSAVYLQQILRSCRSAGIEGRMVELSGEVSGPQLRRRILELNDDPLISGIIVQMPLPADIPLSVVTGAIDPAKDIDGIHPLNAGRLLLGHPGFVPTTAQAAVELLKRSGIELNGRDVVVVGRSNVVGKPAAVLLAREDATVTLCHSRTRDLAGHLARADVVVVAAGRPGLITGAMLKPGATVVDVGINVVHAGTPEERLVGDVDFESVKLVAGAVTPVPGGVGPVTNALLMTHVLQAAGAQVASARPTSHIPAGVVPS
ncbi:MAG TPA: bifunctional 5,10-methylenetetrahydrofolate dehydrogenase/5,10-methenyltetrahydrofolate cyclohydrolase [Candidatus Limnocylindrales bacterium]|nr:bifunctional 5,10-methylenetetrahydrofolate dehydrogenase/5,10-methenyltetrahydrofolate cyclohydrolase [Candidatus Limnocylindrales bacterium]